MVKGFNRNRDNVQRENSKKFKEKDTDSRMQAHKYSYITQKWQWQSKIERPQWWIPQEYFRGPILLSQWWIPQESSPAMTMSLA